MAYQALYRRYRPQRFSDFVGQEAIVRTLAAQVMSGRIAHAYLFCGTRGTGKTSAAKVFARAINCEHPENGDPCGACDTCRALEGDGSLDILEIDAASNNGVDEIRELRENVKYPPRDGRFRVYIIDEVHMLSTGAFNALLKTLEEPPAHAKFILATTEPQKLPATILSRCQRFDFGRIPQAKIAGRLAAAMRENGIPYEEAALQRIARAAEGGMRDAWSITDMCLGYAEETQAGLTDALVRAVLGAADGEFLFSFADAVLSGDGARVLSMIDETMRAGREAQVFLRDVSGHIRTLLLAEVCGSRTAEVLEVPEEDAEAYRRQAGRASREKLLRISEIFLRAEADLKWASQPRFALEAAALRACVPETGESYAALAERVAELERRLAAGIAPQMPGKEEAAPKKTATPAQNGNAETAKPAAAVPAAAEGDRKPDAAAAGDGAAVWKKAMSALRQQPMLFGLLRNGRFVSERDGLFTAAFDRTTGGIHVNLLNGEAQSAAVSAALSAAAGRECRFRAVLEGEDGDGGADASAKKRAEENLGRISSFFGRENVRVMN